MTAFNEMKTISDFNGNGFYLIPHTEDRLIEIDEKFLLTVGIFGLVFVHETGEEMLLDVELERVFIKKLALDI